MVMESRTHQEAPLTLFLVGFGRGRSFASQAWPCLLPMVLNNSFVKLVQEEYRRYMFYLYFSSLSFYSFCLSLKRLSASLSSASLLLKQRKESFISSENWKAL